MCIVSMVMDHYGPLIPSPDDLFPRWPSTGTPRPWRTDPAPSPLPIVPPIVVPEQSNEELRRLIGEFREAVAAARKVDALTGQPDCEDPEKAKLEARVAELERRLDALEKPKPKRKRAAKRTKKAMRAAIPQ